MDAERGVVPTLVGDTIGIEKSPFVQGFLAGVRGLLIGAPAGAAVQAIRGKNPIMGAIIGGLGAGLLGGITKGLAQKVDNVDVEENLRYHALRMKAREPLLFMPPPSVFSNVFSRMHMREHAGYPHAD